MNGRLVVATMATIALGGCSAQSVPPEERALSASPSPSMPSALPTSTKATEATDTRTESTKATPTGSVPAGRTSGPPKEPTDNTKSTAWVVGTVTSDSSGPCYALLTDEGTQYALHATDGTELVSGSRMRVKTAPTSLRIDCGPGRLVEMVDSEALR